jgi:hypothetical protein
MSWIKPGICDFVPSPFGRGGRGEGRAKVHNEKIPFSRSSAFTLALSQRERGILLLKVANVLD